MREYIITIAGAALLGAMADIISPERWRKYVSLITGFVIITCIVTPVAQLMKTDIFSGFDEREEIVNYEQVQLKNVIEETEKRISEDVEKRIREDFGKNVKAKAILKINSDNKIEKVNKIIINSKPDPKITKRMCEVYGINEDEVEYE